MSVPLLLVLVMTGSWCLVIGEFSLGQVLLGLIFGSLFVLVTNAGRGRIVPLSELPERAAYLSVYLLVLQLFVIDAVCSWCVANDVVIAPALALLTGLRLRS